MKALLAVLFLTFGLGAARAQPVQDPDHPGTFLLTIFLRHDETKTLPEINERLRQNGWYRSFPPSGVEIVSWYVMMGSARW